MLPNSTVCGLNAFVGAIPKEGPKCIPQNLDWTAAASYVFDMVQIKQQGKISGVQAVFVDNSTNDQPISFSASIINQIITIAAGYQGYFPLLVSDQVKITFSSTGTKNTPIIFLNFPIAAAVWPALVAAGTAVIAQPVAVTEANLDALISAGALTVAVKNNQTVSTDRSGTIAVGGTSQILAAALATRNKIIIQNIDGAEDLWVRDDGGAAVINGAGSFQVYPGGSFTSTSQSAITVIATTGAHKYTAKDY